jgi:hypothetical protein
MPHGVVDQPEQKRQSTSDRSARRFPWTSSIRVLPDGRPVDSLASRVRLTATVTTTRHRLVSTSNPVGRFRSIRTREFVSSDTVERCFSRRTSRDVYPSRRCVTGAFIVGTHVFNSTICCSTAFSGTSCRRCVSSIVLQSSVAAGRRFALPLSLMEDKCH